MGFAIEGSFLIRGRYSSGGGIGFSIGFVMITGATGKARVDTSGPLQR